jgi:hypothetical protein
MTTRPTLLYLLHVFCTQVVNCLGCGKIYDCRNTTNDVIKFLGGWWVVAVLWARHNQQECVRRGDICPLSVQFDVSAS